IAKRNLHEFRQALVEIRRQATRDERSELDERALQRTIFVRQASTAGLRAYRRRQLPDFAAGGVPDHAAGSSCWIAVLDYPSNGRRTEFLHAERQLDRTRRGRHYLRRRCTLHPGRLAREAKHHAQRRLALRNAKQSRRPRRLRTTHWLG